MTKPEPAVFKLDDRGASMSTPDDQRLPITYWEFCNENGTDITEISVIGRITEFTTREDLDVYE